MKLALLALPLTLLACQTADSETPSIDKPADGKADDPNKLCAALGEQPGCDVCEVAGWYGDGECDHFCTNPDTADCAVGPSTQADFLAATDVPATKDSKYAGNNLYTTSIVVTNQSDADVYAFLEAGAPMVGTGLALHMRFTHYLGGGGVGETMVLYDQTENGQCTDEPIDATYSRDSSFGLYKWDGLEHTLLACPKGGSMRVYPGNNSFDPIRVTFNMVWSDGTVWTNRELTATQVQP